MRQTELMSEGAELDQLLPSWDFREQHRRTVNGSPAEAYAAFRELRIREMPVSRVLFAIRSVPARLSGRGGLPTSSHAPLLDLMLGDDGFTQLADAPPAEIVVGTVAAVARGGAATPLTSTGDTAAQVDAFRAYTRPGAVKLAMAFHFAPAALGRTVVTTETRVLATDDMARRRFRVYWLGIRVFSGLIRREWLAAVARRTAAD